MFYQICHERVMSGEVRLEHSRNTEKKADVLTKTLVLQKLSRFRKMMPSMVSLLFADYN